VKETFLTSSTNGAIVKEMEAAAVAEVAQLLGVPLIVIKGITDYIDHPGLAGETTNDIPWNEQFEKELAPVSETLARIMVKVVEFIMGKKISEL